MEGFALWLVSFWLLFVKKLKSMKKYTIDYLRGHNLIIYEYKRGSHLYHLNVETSDEDYGGIFVCPIEDLIGLRSGYVEQVSDEKNDTVFYELGRWLELLLKANPTVLESLFAPEDCIIKSHPIIDEIRKNRDLFVSKQCFNTFYGYGVSQIGKAHGLNKKIVNPVTERKDILDFCYTFKNQGSQPIKDWLKEHNLDQKYCGLVNLPNMKDVYGVYYDFAAYFKFEDIDWYDVSFQSGGAKYPWSNFISEADAGKISDRIRNKEFYHYSGIVNPDEIKKSNTVRLSSIPKGETPICFMTYNKDGYASHCKDYKEYKEWEEKRNPVRYESNLNKNYDSKNMMHCIRLVRMAKELAQGKGFNVVRDADRQYLLDIRNHKFEYDEVMAQVNKEVEEMEEAMKNCSLQEEIGYDKVNELLIRVRKQFYNN